MEIRVGALGAGVGATAGPEGGGSGGIFCPCAAMAIGRANRAVASANPLLMSILLTYSAKRDRQQVSWKVETRWRRTKVYAEGVARVGVRRKTAKKISKTTAGRSNSVTIGMTAMLGGRSRIADPATPQSGQECEL